MITADGLSLELRMDGANAPSLAGWPTTFAPDPNAAEAKPSPLDVEDLIAVAEEILVLEDLN